MSPESAWPPELPEVVLDWPVPRGVKIRPARWVGGDAANYRAHFQAAVDVGMALAVICNDAPRGSGARVARWFCPGVPMHVTGEQVVGKDGRVQHVFLVPAQAALLALERGLITWLAE
ncbi:MULTISPECIES: hypothetical protein [Deinococcus]|uniref:hypothetical protein n=1 Tax=Deinococcus TaxID=1298 RepID=UPI000A848389|nr:MULTISPECIES: hypothetical protein [Deinococcus]MCD0168720.1 hypothetical protein [Deinococcus sp. 23YEL01]PIG95976.1 hypothetical protein AMD26_018840 [Deinococcus sp. UR1]GHG41597.1 hypothetical protein GCM10017784_40580 [Deinococcus indicus]